MKTSVDENQTTPRKSLVVLITAAAVLLSGVAAYVLLATDILWQKKTADVYTAQQLLAGALGCDEKTQRSYTPAIENARGIDKARLQEGAADCALTLQNIDQAIALLSTAAETYQSEGNVERASVLRNKVQAYKQSQDNKNIIQDSINSKQLEEGSQPREKGPVL